MPLVLFNQLIGPYQVLPRWARVDLGAMAMKGCFHSPKPRHYWNLTIRLFSVIPRTLIGGPYNSAEVKPVYSTAQADWAEKNMITIKHLLKDKISAFHMKLD